jgi:Fe-S cluster assembly iron-binding protein IscA
MLALTQGAADVIKEIVDSEPEPGSGTGLRIAAESMDSSEPQLSMSIADGPEAGDETVEQHGATVYVSESASELLSDKVLDAHTHEDHVHFTIADQGSE